MGYKFHGFEIPDRMMPGLELYIGHGIPPGGFLTAVIENNLVEAVGKADSENLYNLPAYAGYMYNEAPMPCWGSREKMQIWMEKFK